MWTRRRMNATAATLLITCVVSGCAAANMPTQADSSVKTGQWAGEHIIMAVGAASTLIEFDCGRATVRGAINVDRNGEFTASGTFFQEGPGASRPGDPAQFPMRISGTVKGDEMHVSVVLTDNNQPVGSFTVTFGGTARLAKCK